jgi:hypothetical protein
LKPDVESEAASETAPEAVPAAVCESEAATLLLVKDMMAAAEAKGVKTRVASAIQNELRVVVDGKLTRGQGKLLTGEMIIRYTDGITKVRPKPVSSSPTER